MLRINAEPGYFTEIFTELKACGMTHSSSSTTLSMNQLNSNHLINSSSSHITNNILNNNMNNLSINGNHNNNNLSHKSTTNIIVSPINTSTATTITQSNGNLHYAAFNPA